MEARKYILGSFPPELSWKESTSEFFGGWNYPLIQLTLFSFTCLPAHFIFLYFPVGTSLSPHFAISSLTFFFFFFNAFIAIYSSYSYPQSSNTNQENKNETEKDFPFFPRLANSSPSYCETPLAQLKWGCAEQIDIKCRSWSPCIFLY